MLAYMPPEELFAVLPQLEFRRLTENSIGSVQELQTQLQKVRKNGYACDLEEYEPHIRCIATPIWDHTGAVNASVSITGPAVRMSLTRLKQLAPLIQSASKRISKEMGYQASSSGNEHVFPPKHRPIGTQSSKTSIPYAK
jgi:DNA-binding IclR family transcriptional regulator